LTFFLFQIIILKMTAQWFSRLSVMGQACPDPFPFLKRGILSWIGKEKNTQNPDLIVSI